ncbi:hypothetical protein [Cupriavidus pinatubonensis]|uniref:hypothetical protein n=1 Tax=Cupriavidus pinatubonensis TaxID=248026 RepID=UPI00112EBCCA|nr:hypothetical protein [Cupriavidus pinatubonensis]TPQ32032.1 hypothetical protein C2U69_27480 [Cupriavidus pinatubonensis]
MSSTPSRPKRLPKPVIVALENAAMTLGIHDKILMQLVRRHGCRLQRDASGRVGIAREDVQALASSPDYLSAVRASVRREQQYRARKAPHAANALAAQRSLIAEFEGYADDLEAIHRRQLTAVNAAGAESAAMAAYLLVSKAIALLRMLTLALEHQHWYAGTLLRDIDECLDAAKYFAETHRTPAGAKALERWFRLNESPKHADLRASAAEHFGEVLGEDNHREVLDELYHKKSKWPHPTYLAIREVARYADDGMTLVSPSYGPCAEPAIIADLTAFARSSFWSTYQVMALALHRTGVLAPADWDLLLQRDVAFQQRNEQTRA